VHSIHLTVGAMVVVAWSCNKKCEGVIGGNFMKRAVINITDKGVKNVLSDTKKLIHDFIIEKPRVKYVDMESTRMVLRDFLKVK